MATDAASASPDVPPSMLSSSNSANVLLVMSRMYTLSDVTSAGAMLLFVENTSLKLNSFTLGVSVHGMTSTALNVHQVPAFAEYPLLT